VSRGECEPLGAGALEVARAASPTPGGHILALDGVRGVAVLLVLFYHFTMFGRLWFLVDRGAAWEQGVTRSIAFVAMSGWTGVDLFFVLSGYLITTILLGQKGRPHFFRNFYARRAARILPLYYAFLAGYAVYIVVFDPEMGLRALTWPLVFGTNLAIGFGGDGAVAHSLQHLWSLAVEEQFYLLFPLLVATVSTEVLRLVCAVGIVGSLLFRWVAWDAVPLCAYLTPARFDGLLVGALVASLLDPRRATASSPSLRRYAGWALALTSLAVSVVVMQAGSYATGRPEIDFVGRTPLVLFFGALVAVCVVAPRTIIARALAIAPLRFFGRYSYAMYVLHMPVFAALSALHVSIRRLAAPTGSLLVGYVEFFTLAMLATTLSALASYYLLERHFMSLRDRLRGDSRAPPSTPAPSSPTSSA
jgi:peptidoglycan/LPS O-acetylase OafA/YrhL